MLENREIAELLEAIASLLEVDEVGWFKVQAYKNAADTIRAHPDSVAALSAAGQDLTELQDVGKAIAGRIEEMLTQGYEPFRVALEGESPGILELLRIPGLGPKRVRLLREHLNVTSIDALQAAAEAGRVRDLPGMGEKTEQSILRRIARSRDPG